MKTQSNGEYALKGVGVLDLAGEQGSFGSSLLADLGARVIKVDAEETRLERLDPLGEALRILKRTCSSTSIMPIN